MVHMAYSTASLRRLVTFGLEEDRIEEDGRTHDETLLLRCCVLGKIDLKDVGIGKDLSCGALHDLQDLARRLGTVVSVLHVGGEDVEGSLATASSEAGVALSATVDAHATDASRLVHLVDGLSFGIVDLEARNAAVALLLDLDVYVSIESIRKSNQRR